jgi:hypothetical protein
MLAGGTHSMFRMGRFVDYGEDVNHGGLLTALINAMGIESEGFGHPDFAVGPLSDLT